MSKKLIFAALLLTLIELPVGTLSYTCIWSDKRSVEHLRDSNNDLIYRIIFRWGYRQPGDYLVNESSNRNAKSLYNHKYAFPQSGQRYWGTITYVEVASYQKSDSGDACLTQGGIGRSSMTLQVNSYDFHEFNVYVSVYGT